MALLLELNRNILLLVRLRKTDISLEPCLRIFETRDAAVGETGAPRFGRRFNCASSSDSCSKRAADMLLQVRIIVPKNCGDKIWVMIVSILQTYGQWLVLALLLLMLMIG